MLHVIATQLLSAAHRPTAPSAQCRSLPRTRSPTTTRTGTAAGGAATEGAAATSATATSRHPRPLPGPATARYHCPTAISQSNEEEEYEKSYCTGWPGRIGFNPAGSPCRAVLHAIIYTVLEKRAGKAFVRFSARPCPCSSRSSPLCGGDESEFGNEGLMQIYDAASLLPRDNA